MGIKEITEVTIEADYSLQLIPVLYAGNKGRVVVAKFISVVNQTGKIHLVRYDDPIAKKFVDGDLAVTRMGPVSVLQTFADVSEEELSAVLQVLDAEVRNFAELWKMWT